MRSPKNAGPKTLSTKKTTIDSQEKFHAAWERVTLAEAGLRRLQEAEFQKYVFQLHASCMAAGVAAVGSE